MRLRFLLIIAVAAAAVSCTKTVPEVDYTPLVVDGWIDAGGAPVVLVSRTAAPSETLHDETSLMSKVVTYARVRVSDGSRTVELHGKRDDNYYPPYIYTTDEMVGEAGKRYRLEVDYPGINAWAETTIPEPATIDRFEVEVSERTDSLYKLTAHFRDNPATRDYYKFFTKVEGRNTAWNSSFLGLVDDAFLDGSDVTVPVARGWGLLQKYRQPLFLKGEKVAVKFCTVDAQGYAYWKSYDDLTALARNPFFPVSENAATNMHGALGFWGGYGATFYEVTIE